MATNNELMISVIEAIAQAENDSRSRNTKWGIIRKAENGTSELYKRRCYGYEADSNGDLQINLDEAAVVQEIFALYLSGKQDSLLAN